MEEPKKRKCDRIVYDVMKIICPARTSQIAMACFAQGIGTDSSIRYARWLRERGCVRSYKAEDDDKELTFAVISEFVTQEEHNGGKSRAVVQSELPGMMI